LPSAIKLIVGLANPGQEYEATRHNAGAWFIDEIARANHLNLRPENKFYGLHTKTTIAQQSCHLFIPTTYMNLSGQAVAACMNFYKIHANEILVVHDEIDLEPGTIKLKFDGGAGGHNGLTDIIRHLHSKEFYRLRIGVGHPGNSKQVADYVLKRPPKSDKEKIDDAIYRALHILPDIMQGEFQRAMNTLHSD